MMSTTGLLCLVAALVSTVSCYTTCTKCLNKNGNYCVSEETVECPNGCATFSEHCIVNNRPVPSIKKGCAPNGLTETVALAFNDHDQVLEYLHVALCEGHQCNKEARYVFDPAGLGPPNGLYCESCSRENSKAKECHSCDRVACRGGQNQCLSLSGTFKRGDGTILHYVTKGCVSDLGCVVKFSLLPGTNILQERTFNCTNASPYARDCSECGGNFYY